MHYFILQTFRLQTLRLSEAVGNDKPPIRHLQTFRLSEAVGNDSSPFDIYKGYASPRRWAMPTKVVPLRGDGQWHPFDILHSKFDIPLYTASATGRMA